MSSALRILPKAIIPRSIISVPKLQRSQFSTTTRKMSNLPPPPPGQYEWICIIPDHEGALDKRMEVRPAHFAGLQKDVDAGFWKVGGAILEEVPKEGEAMKIQGSAMVCVAASREEVIEKLKKDIYAESDVWDFSKIYPFKCAFRHP